MMMMLFLMTAAIVLVKTQAHAEPGIELGMICQFQKSHLCRLETHQFFGFQQELIFKPVDLIEDHDIGVFQLLVQDKINGPRMIRHFC